MCVSFQSEDTVRAATRSHNPLSGNVPVSRCIVQDPCSTVLCEVWLYSSMQALYRGRVARKLLPQWKKEKQTRDVRYHLLVCGIGFKFVCLALAATEEEASWLEEEGNTSR